MIAALLVYMEHNSMIIATVAILLFGCQDKSDPSSNDRITTSAKHIDLKFIKGESAINALNQVFAGDTRDIEFSTTGYDSITITTNNSAHLERALALIQVFDQPSSGPPTKWVPLATLDLDRAAIRLKGQIPDDSFQAIPEPRTKRMFLMGTQQNLDHATEILLNIEAEQAAPGQPATRPLSK